VLGGDFLKQFDATIDYGNVELTLAI
jgi:hypothetical protein